MLFTKLGFTIFKVGSNQFLNGWIIKVYVIWSIRNGYHHPILQIYHPTVTSHLWLILQNHHTLYKDVTCVTYLYNSERWYSPILENSWALKNMFCNIKLFLPKHEFLENPIFLPKLFLAHKRWTWDDRHWSALMTWGICREVSPRPVDVYITHSTFEKFISIQLVSNPFASENLSSNLFKTQVR